MFGGLGMGQLFIGASTLDEGSIAARKTIAKNLASLLEDCAAILSSGLLLEASINTESQPEDIVIAALKEAKFRKTRAERLAQKAETARLSANSKKTEADYTKRHAEILGSQKGSAACNLCKKYIQEAQKLEQQAVEAEEAAKVSKEEANTAQLEADKLLAILKDKELNDGNVIVSISGNIDHLAQNLAILDLQLDNNLSVEQIAQEFLCECGIQRHVKNARIFNLPTWEIQQ